MAAEEKEVLWVKWAGEDGQAQTRVSCPETLRNVPGSNRTLSGRAPAQKWSNRCKGARRQTRVAAGLQTKSRRVL